jgi:hypothetical protein
MKTNDSVLSRVNRAFVNAKSVCLTKHEIDFPIAGQIVKVSSQLFQLLDRTDPAQAEVARRLWVLRSSILFTFLPFGDTSLKLQQQVNDLDVSSTGLPDATPFIELLKKYVKDIVSDGQNPKRDWLQNFLPEQINNEVKIGIFKALSSGKPPGWPSERRDCLPVSSEQILFIESRRQLFSQVFGTIIIPCSCNNAPISLLSNMLFSGVSTKFDVLLYPGEKFNPPKRLLLPRDDIFTDRLQKTEFESSIIEVPNALLLLSEVDSWMNEAFWQGLHGAARNKSPNLTPANYVLFSDCTGTFLPVNGRVLALPSSGEITNENDLCTIHVEDISEGDRLILRSGDSGFLLDEASDRIMGSSDNETLFELATDWKEPLDALLVTKNCEQVAQTLRDRGVPASAVSVHQWVGLEVLGPRDEHVFRELIKLLADTGKIQVIGADLISYADKRWSSLQELRGLRQKAGNLIRQDLFKALFNRFGNECDKSADRVSIHIEGDIGTELLVLRVSSVDRSTAHIHHSRLGQMDDLKGNKWLG